MSNGKKNWLSRWIDRVMTVLGIVAIILIIGLVILYFADKAKQEKKKPKEEKPEKSRLQIVQERITELEPQKQILLSREKRYFFIARLIIAIILVTINWLYLRYDNWTNFSLGDQLNINAGIVLTYSFVAFILYGSPSALVKAIKRRASQVFLRNQIHVLSELEQLEEEEANIQNEMNEIDKLEKAATKAIITLKQDD